MASMRRVFWSPGIRYDHSAIDIDPLADDVRRIVGQEKCDHPGHILRLAKPAERVSEMKCVAAASFDQIILHPRFDDPGRHGVDADLLSPVRRANVRFSPAIAPFAME